MFYLYFLAYANVFQIYSYIKKQIAVVYLRLFIVNGFLKYIDDKQISFDMKNRVFIKAT